MLMKRGIRRGTRPVRPALRALASVGLAALLCAVPARPASAAPGDFFRNSQQFVFTMMDTAPAWQVSKGAGVTVAVIDSGVNPNVSDLSGSTVIKGPDLTTLHTPPSNPSWGQHGTWMASIIAGHGHDGGVDGISGIAPEAKILSIRVIPDKGDPGYKQYNDQSEDAVQSELAQGIRAAVKDGAKVISMSIGYNQPSGMVRDAVAYAYTHGVILIASSGNAGQNDTQQGSGGPKIAPVSYPAEYPGVLSVGAVDEAGAYASFSSANLSVQIAAPGVGVPAQGNTGQYFQVKGTSPACALVAGAAALIEARYPGISPAQVTDALIGTARQTPHGAYTVSTGFGIVDAGAAMAKAGQLMHEKAQQSPVSTAAHFGGCPAAVPAAPVTPRGDGRFISWLLLAAAAVLVMSFGGYRLHRARRL
jgi:type VII secretion-associated serine protease mycosin